MSHPKFSGLHLYVRDMAAALAFYRRLGIAFPADAEQGVFASADLGDGIHLAFGTFALTRGYDPGFREPRGGSPNSLQFDVDSRERVDRIYRVPLGLRTAALRSISHFANRSCRARSRSAAARSISTFAGEPSESVA